MSGDRILNYRAAIEGFIIFNPDTDNFSTTKFLRLVPIVKRTLPSPDSHSRPSKLLYIFNSFQQYFPYLKDARAKNEKLEMRI